MAKKLHKVRPTLLIVGEGDCEEAFLRHLRDLYCSGGTGVSATIRNAHGKGPENVVQHVIRQSKNAAYDHRVAFLDMDIPWTEKLKKDARRFKIDMVGSSPCLEGFLLTILSLRAPEKSDACKKLIHQKIGVDLTEWPNCAAHFPKDRLDAMRRTLPALEQLLCSFEGPQD